MSKPFDATLNHLLDAHADDWAAFLAARTNVPLGPVASLDTDLSTTLQADRLFRIDGPHPAVVHLELESSGRRGMPEGLFRYNVAARGVTDRPVHSVVVLLRPKANATDLTGFLELPDANGATYITFRYTVVRLWQEGVDALLSRGVGLAPLALLTDEASADLPAAFHRFDQRLRAPDVSASLRDSLLGATFVLGGLRYTDAQIEGLYMSLDEILQDSSTYKLLVNRGRAQGKVETILSLAERRFGPPSEPMRTAVAAIKDLPRLERMSIRVLDATGWDDLLATD